VDPFGVGRGPFWDGLWTLLTDMDPFGCVWTHSSRYGPFWVGVDPFGVGREHFWGDIDPFGCRWTLLDVCAPFWGRVDPPWCAAYSPGTKGCSGNLSLFAGIPMMFPVILGTWSKMELVYQEKEFVAGRLSENEQLGNSR